MKLCSSNNRCLLCSCNKGYQEAHKQYWSPLQTGRIRHVWIQLMKHQHGGNCYHRGSDRDILTDLFFILSVGDESSEMPAPGAWVRHERRPELPEAPRLAGGVMFTGHRLLRVCTVGRQWGGSRRGASGELSVREGAAVQRPLWPAALAAPPRGLPSNLGAFLLSRGTGV